MLCNTKGPMEQVRFFPANPDRTFGITANCYCFLPRNITQQMYANFEQRVGGRSAPANPLARPRKVTDYVFSNLHARTGLYFFRYIDNTDIESMDRSWNASQDLTPQATPPSLLDANGFFNVQPIMDQQAQPASTKASAPTPVASQHMNPATPQLKHDQTVPSTPVRGTPKEEKAEVDVGTKSRKDQAQATATAKLPRKEQKDKEQKDPEPSPDPKSIKNVEMSLGKILNRINTACAQSEQIVNLIKTDESWQWIASTPAHQEFVAVKKKFHDYKDCNSLMKALLLNGQDFGPKADLLRSRSPVNL